VLDPPRAGAGRPVLDQLLAPGTGLGRVGYVSCDPATLARDIATFRQAGWQLGELRAFDAFPMTHHVECVATLTLG
jgi:tRNA/tmRNA/rRNA uracil-C5-methylase (TrmA/RlmC/RlmD family)